MRALLFAATTLLLLLAPTFGARAELFRSSYLSFALPPGWQCSLEGTEWVCEDQSEGKEKTAIIILTAKERGSDDRLDLFEDHLSAPKPVTDAKGMPTGRSSKVEFVIREPIGARMWVHSRQFESEVPNYYTDYFATVDDEIAILLTFSAYKDSFQIAFQRFYPSMATILPENRANR
jgi:hypothetical protein